MEGVSSVNHNNIARPVLRASPKSHGQYLKETWQIYIMILPALILVVVFCYWPIYGIQIAFKDFRLGQGIVGSSWIGFDHFIRFFRAPQFWTLLRNTLGISIYSLAAGFPIPILLSLMLNESRSRRFKQTVQMITYAPYFISTVAICGMLLLFLKKDSGVLNALVMLFGGEAKEFITLPKYFWSIYVWSGIWQNAGWGTIIYLAALSSVSHEIVEAAVIDGANRLQKIIHIDLPAIAPTIVILLILNIGSLLNVGFEKTLLLQNSLNMDMADVISTYTYRLGVLDRQYDYTTAIGLFNSLVNVGLLISINGISRKLGDTSLW